MKQMNILNQKYYSLKAKILSARIKRNDKSKLDDYKEVYNLYKKAKQLHSNSYIDIELSKLDILTGEIKKHLID